MLLQSRSKCNLFYGRQTCNVKPPNSDEAILLGARVLVDVTATGDINGVAAAKRSRRFCPTACRQTASPSRTGHGAEPSQGVKSSCSPSCSQQRPAAEFLHATKAPAPRQGEDPIAGAPGEAAVPPAVIRDPS
ncbi:hypothetical protein TcCL_ESM09871 [Trypanosoma cruzi]|nr:hypothetical protein TcCL_ESM09871 [Trypanosoma cruzi]